MAKTAHSSTFLADRRKRLGKEPHEMAAAIGVSQEVYRAWECRGQLPQNHFEKIAPALGVTVQELKAEVVATLAYALLGVSKDETHGFIAKALRSK